MTDFHGDQAKKNIFFAKKIQNGQFFKMAIIPNYQFSKNFVKISWIGPWVSWIDWCSWLLLEAQDWCSLAHKKYKTRVIMASVWYISLEYIPNLCVQWSKVDSTTIFLFWNCQVQLSFWDGLLTSCSMMYCLFLLWISNQPASFPDDVRSLCLIMLQMELPSDNTATVADYFNWIEIASFKSR